MKVILELGIASNMELSPYYIVQQNVETGPSIPVDPQLSVGDGILYGATGDRWWEVVKVTFNPVTLVKTYQCRTLVNREYTKVVEEVVGFLNSDSKNKVLRDKR